MTCTKKTMNVEALTEKARRYCAYRERCTREVEDKLLRLGADRHATSQVIRVLREEDFLDDQRYANIFVRGKFRQNGWGKVKIKAALLAKHIPEGDIHEALEEIDTDDYLRKLRALMTKKKQELQTGNKAELRAKTAAYCIQKGYEPALVWEMMREV